ncbi:hypothetical protein ABTG52_11660, partial [Acinetobacter baumannii]
MNLDKMSCCLKAGFSVSGSSDVFVKNRGKGSVRVCSAIGSLQFKESNSTEFLGKSLDVASLNFKAPKLDPVYAQSTLSFPKSLKWWEKSLQPNMIEIHSAQELVDSLLNAGDR